MEAYARFLDLVGPSRLAELVFTARLYSAEEAKAAGLVHEIVAADAIEARVRTLAGEIAGHAPLTLRVTKEAIRRIQSARRLPAGDDLVALAYGSADFREGVRAFLEKRPARWTGS
jgi:enoyl-CoA hydratase/carnithine racemase